MKGERREARLDGAKPIKNSGRGMLKGDASLGPALIDYKAYTSSFSISKKNWTKHSEDASNDGYEMAVFSVVLGDEDASQVKVAVIDWEWFKYFLEEYTAFQEEQKRWQDDYDRRKRERWGFE